MEGTDDRDVLVLGVEDRNQYSIQRIEFKFRDNKSKLFILKFGQRPKASKWVFVVLLLMLCGFCQGVNNF